MMPDHTKKGRRPASGVASFPASEKNTAEASPPNVGQRVPPVSKQFLVGGASYTSPHFQRPSLSQGLVFLLLVLVLVLETNRSSAIRALD